MEHEVGAQRRGWSRFGAPLHLVLAVGTFVVFMLWVLPAQAERSAEFSTTRPPDLRVLYTPDDLVEIFDDYGEAGRQAYIRSRYVFDLVWPLAYTYFYVAMLAWLMPRAFPRGGWLRQHWPRIALAPFVLDLLENALTGSLAYVYPNRHDGWAWTASVVSTFKWAAVVAVTLSLAGATVAAVRARRGAGE
jgi:hypothetical protein